MLLDTFPFAFYYFHLVFCTKFAIPMSTHKCKGSFPTYTLGCKIEQTILQALGTCTSHKNESKQKSMKVKTLIFTYQHNDWLHSPIIICQVAIRFASPSYVIFPNYYIDKTTFIDHTKLLSTSQIME
jgi:hypothetical protein